jgi:cytochrome c oxidase assembly factor CtaG
VPLSIQRAATTTGIAAALVMCPWGKVWAHVGAPLEPHDLWTAWVLEPWAVVLLGASLALYVRGTRRVWYAAGHGRGTRPIDLAAFIAGWIVLALALLSPIHAAGSVLLTAHMIQHELLILVAAPLLVLGRPIVPALWALPPTWRGPIGAIGQRRTVRAIWRRVSRPLDAALIHGAAVWIWHSPTAYEAAVRSPVLHALEHATFIGTALLFWWSVLHVRHSRVRDGQAIAVMFLTALHTGALGALLTFAGGLWYPVYAATTGPWGLSPLEDQQLAGLIMWIPGGGVYVLVGLVLAARWMGESRLLPRMRTVASVLLLLLGVACKGGLDDDRTPTLLGGNAERGKIAMGQYGCTSCHMIPGIAGARGTAGPPLSGIAARGYIAGVLPNSPENMVRWIMNPQQVDSLTAMPDLGVSDTLARDMAEYLYRIK